MFENKSYIQIKISSERSFGIVFCAFFIILGLYPLLKGQDIRLWAIIIAFIFLFLGIFIPQLLFIPNKLWFKIGIFLGSIVSPIIMGLIFFLTVTPIGIIMRILGKDILNQEIKKSVKSYWIKRREKVRTMKKQF
tara:strand:+ start:431 stop:835 length:405 start_codon:yes stop_codon:yes gene_type:complete